MRRLTNRADEVSTESWELHARLRLLARSRQRLHGVNQPSHDFLESRHLARRFNTNVLGCVNVCGPAPIAGHAPSIRSDAASLHASAIRKGLTTRQHAMTCSSHDESVAAQITRRRRQELCALDAPAGVDTWRNSLVIAASWNMTERSHHKRGSNPTPSGLY